MPTQFQTTIEYLLRSHNLLEQFQSQSHFHVRFDMPHFDRLVIERHDELISVAHYFEQNGDLIADPEVELHYPTWMPTAITQVIGGRREKFVYYDDETYVDLRFHGEVAMFLDLWAHNIQAQKWAERGKVYVDDSRKAPPKEAA